MTNPNTWTDLELLVHAAFVGFQLLVLATSFLQLTLQVLGKVKGRMILIKSYSDLTLAHKQLTGMKKC